MEADVLEAEEEDEQANLIGSWIVQAVRRNQRSRHQLPDLLKDLLQGIQSPWPGI